MVGQIDPGQLGAAVAAILVAVGSAAAALDRRNASRSATQAEAMETWRQLAEARGAAEHDCIGRVVALEEQVRLMQGEWMASVADGITRGVVEALPAALERIVAELRER